MDNQIRLLYSFYEDAVDEDLDFKYQVPYEASEYYRLNTESMRALISDSNYEVDALDFKWIYDMFEFHFEYALFAKIKCNDEALAAEHFSIANAYGNAAVHFGSQCCDKMLDQQPYIPMNKATLILSSCILSNDDERADETAEHLLDSLNKQSCIIKRGQPNATIAWFIMQLYIRSSGRSLDINSNFLPKEFDAYQAIVDEWDTQDEQLLEKNICILADNHIARAIISQSINIDNRENETFKFSELFLESLYLLPYEILTLLAIRKRNHLTCPADFSHELMKTPIVKMLLNTDAPHASPAQLPLLNDILTKINHQYSH